MKPNRGLGAREKKKGLHGRPRLPSSGHRKEGFWQSVFSFHTIYIIHTFFQRFELLFQCITQFGGISHCLNSINFVTQLLQKTENKFHKAIRDMFQTDRIQPKARVPLTRPCQNSASREQNGTYIGQINSKLQFCTKLRALKLIKLIAKSQQSKKIRPLKVTLIHSTYVQNEEKRLRLI